MVPGTRIYVGDVMTLVGVAQDLNRLVPRIGQPINVGDRTDVAFVAAGLAVGLLIGLLSFKIGPVPLTLGGGGGALIAGLSAVGGVRGVPPLAHIRPRRDR